MLAQIAVGEEPARTAPQFSKSRIDKANISIKALGKSVVKTNLTNAVSVFRHLSQIITNGYVRKEMKKKYYPPVILQVCSKFYDAASVIYLEAVQIQHIHRYIDECFAHSNPCTIYVYVHKIRRMLSIGGNINDIIEIFANSNLIQRFIQYLKFLHLSNYNIAHEIFDKLQLEIIWALTNIASGGQGPTLILVNNGTIEMLVELLNDTSQTPEIIDQVIWALGNMAGDGPEIRDLVLKSDIIPVLDKLLHDNVFNIKDVNDFAGIKFGFADQPKELPTILNDDSSTTNMADLQINIYPKLQKLDHHGLKSLLSNFVWVVSNFVRGKPLPEWSYVLKVIEMLSYSSKLSLIKSNKNAMLDLFWGLSFISSCDSVEKIEEFVKILFKNGLLDVIIQGLNNAGNDLIAHPAVRTLGSIIANSDADECIDICLSHGMLIPFCNFLQRPVGKFSSLKKEICWTIANITAGTQEQIQRVFDAGLIPILFNILKGDENIDVKKEVLWVISNATVPSSDIQIRFMVDNGLIEELCALCPLFFDGGIFSGLRNSSKFVKIIIESFENIVKYRDKRIDNLNSNNTDTNSDMKNNHVNQEFVNMIEEHGGFEFMVKICSDERYSDCHLFVTNSMEKNFDQNRSKKLRAL